MRRLRIEIDEASGERAMPRREFVPVELLGHLAAPDGVAPGDEVPHAPAEEPVLPMPPMRSELDEGWAERTSLFGEREA